MQLLVTAKLLQYSLKRNIMKKFSHLFIVALALSTTLTSCELVGDIFKAGAYTAIIGIVLVVILIFWLISRFRR